MGGRISAILLACLASMMLIASGGIARAAPDAQIDQEIRPCFGALIRLQRDAARCGGERPQRPAWRPSGGGSLDIDCDRAYPGQIQDAIYRAWPGATVTLRSRYRPCVESITIDRPIRILAVDFSPAPNRPILVAQPGQPCIKIEAGVPWVLLRGLMIESLEAGKASCVLGSATQLRLEGSIVRYDGEGSAIDVTGSMVEIADSTIIVRSRQPAVRLSGRMDIADVDIAATASGMALETDGDSRLSRVAVIRLGDWTGTGRVKSSVGLALAGLNRQQLIQLDDVTVDGFSRGIFVGGGNEVALNRPIVRDSDWAVLLENTNLNVLDGKLQAGDVGLYAASGVMNAGNNKISGVMRAGIFAEKGAEVRARDNEVASKACGALKTGYFTGALTCKSWFDQPELFRSTADKARVNFNRFWSVKTAASDTAPAQP